MITKRQVIIAAVFLCLTALPSLAAPENQANQTIKGSRCFTSFYVNIGKPNEEVKFKDCQIVYVTGLYDKSNGLNFNFVDTNNNSISFSVNKSNGTAQGAKNFKVTGFFTMKNAVPNTMFEGEGLCILKERAESNSSKVWCSIKVNNSDVSVISGLWD
jgi:hypothetical protein